MSRPLILSSHAGQNQIKFCKNENKFPKLDEKIIVHNDDFAPKQHLTLFFHLITSNLKWHSNLGATCNKAS